MLINTVLSVCGPLIDLRVFAVIPTGIVVLHATHACVSGKIIHVHIPSRNGAQRNGQFRGTAGNKVYIITSVKVASIGSIF